MRNVVIAGFARSPFTLANKGALMRVRPDDMAAQVISALIERTRVRPQDIEDVIVGCAFPEGTCCSLCCLPRSWCPPR